MLLDALMLSALTTTGFILVYGKLPRKVRKFIEKHSLMSDIIALGFTYMLLGGTLTALTAGAMVGIFTSALLYVANNPEDFMYLYDLKDMVKQQLGILKVKLNELGANYRANRVFDEVQPALNQSTSTAAH